MIFMPMTSWSDQETEVFERVKSMQRTCSTFSISEVFFRQLCEANKYIFLCKIYKEEFEDTKELIRIRKLKNRQHNGQIKKYIRTNNDLQSIQIILKIE